MHPSILQKKMAISIFQAFRVPVSNNASDSIILISGDHELEIHNNY